MQKQDGAITTIEYMWKLDNFTGKLKKVRYRLFEFLLKSYTDCSSWQTASISEDLMQFLKLFIIFISASLFSGYALAEYASSKAEAAQLAQEQVAGMVLKVEQRGNKYKVKILQSSGRVVSIMINKKAINKKEQNKEQGNAQWEFW